MKNLALMSIVAIMLVACGGENGTSAKDDDSSSSVAEKESSSAAKGSSSSAKEGSSSAKATSSSSAKYVCDIYTLSDALSCKCDEDRLGKLAYNYDSKVELECIYDKDLNKYGWLTKKDESSSSSAKSGSSSSVTQSSSSDVILSASEEPSRSSSSSVAKSSCSVAKSSSSSAKSSSSSAKSSSSSVKVSSSSEYVPFDHSVTLAGEFEVGEDAYKQFVDERNGRSYYYITIAGKDTSGNPNSVTVMAENLNIGEMVRGIKEQSDDTKIERYCYKNDTTRCDMYGALYQWAEMMQLPSSCNTESCADKIEPNHQGICPDGWRLLTYNDFYTIWHANTNDEGVKGLRSSYFSGSNYTGYSLLGSGIREKEGNFTNIGMGEFWYYPVEREYEGDAGSYVQTNSLGTSSIEAPGSNSLGSKTYGRSVRCVMLETEE